MCTLWAPFALTQSINVDIKESVGTDSERTEDEAEPRDIQEKLDTKEQLEGKGKLGFFFIVLTSVADPVRS